MREILFRGKRKLGNEWIEGSLHTEKFTDDEEFLCCEVCQCDVYPETVGQYTGLTDKKGKKIFEGDIVKWNINYAIVWQDCKFVLKKDINAKSYDYVLSCFDGTELEVIGNIHDNPELLS